MGAASTAVCPRFGGDLRYAPPQALEDIVQIESKIDSVARAVVGGGGIGVAVAEPGRSIHAVRHALQSPWAWAR